MTRMGGSIAWGKRGELRSEAAANSEAAESVVCGAVGNDVSGVEEDSDLVSEAVFNARSRLTKPDF